MPGVQAYIKIPEMIYFYYVVLRGYFNSFRDIHMTNMFIFFKKCLFRKKIKNKLISRVVG